MLGRAVTLSLGLSALPTLARAEPPYRDELATADASALAIAVFGRATDDPTLRRMAAVPLLLGAPVVHGLHGHLGRAAASLALRAAPIGFAAAALPTCDAVDPGESGMPRVRCLLGVLAVASLALAAGVAVDYAVLAAGTPDDAPFVVRIGGSF
jgi:hypothetical protein